MYYAVQDYRQTYIGRAYMDGKNDGVLINGTDMVWPEGLTIDYTSKLQVIYSIHSFVDSSILIYWRFQNAIYDVSGSV